MPKSNKGPVSGGRAYYKGQSAYASQSYELEARTLVGKLGGLLVAYLGEDQAILASTNTTILFKPSFSSALSQNLFMRGFGLIQPGYFTCRTTGTYKFSFSVRVGTSGTGPVNLRGTLRVDRAPNAVEFFSITSNTSTTSGNMQTQLQGYVDLVQGDTIYLYAQSENAVTLSSSATGGTTSNGGVLDTFRATYLHLEQIDI